MFVDKRNSQTQGLASIGSVEVVDKTTSPKKIEFDTQADSLGLDQ
jgi:hypothetical protein